MGGYGFAFGFITVLFLLRAKARNTSIALLTGLAVGVCASYFSWNGYVHALIDKAPILASPSQLQRLMRFLYEHGS